MALPFLPFITMYLWNQESRKTFPSTTLKLNCRGPDVIIFIFRNVIHLKMRCVARKQPITMPNAAGHRIWGRDLERLAKLIMYSV